MTLDTRAKLVKLTDLDLDNCTFCEAKITIETDKKWVVCNVYEACCILPPCVRCHGTGRRWDRIEYYHVVCYDTMDYPFGN